MSEYFLYSKTKKIHYGYKIDISLYYIKINRINEYYCSIGKNIISINFKSKEESVLAEYIIKRVFQGILLVFVVSILIFLLMQLMPGNPVDLVAGPRVSEEKKAEIRIKWGFDKPIYQQYIIWAKNILKGNFGMSIRSKQSVSKILKQKIPYTIKLVGASMLAQFLIAVPLGLLAAFKKDKFTDKFLVIGATIFSSIPRFWCAVILILIFSVKLNWLPMNGLDSVKGYIMPVTAIVLSGITVILRLTRSEVLEVLREKYVATAYAKGLKNKIVLIKHVLRNALIPVCVMFFLSLPWMIGGEVIIESIFSIPGMGRLLYSSIVTQDLPVIQACILIIAILTVICNLIGDILTGFLDPRIRVELKGGTK